MAAITFAFSYWVIDVKRYRSWARPFAIYGAHAIAAYCLAGILARALNLIRVSSGDGATESLRERIFRTAFAPLTSPVNASMAFAVCFVLLMYGIARFMYRRKWFVKILSLTARCGRRPEPTEMLGCGRRPHRAVLEFRSKAIKADRIGHRVPLMLR